MLFRFLMAMDISLHPTPEVPDDITYELWSMGHLKILIWSNRYHLSDSGEGEEAVVEPLVDYCLDFSEEELVGAEHKGRQQMLGWTCAQSGDVIVAKIDPNTSQLVKVSDIQLKSTYGSISYQLPLPSIVQQIDRLEALEVTATSSQDLQSRLSSLYHLYSITYPCLTGHHVVAHSPDTHQFIVYDHTDKPDTSVSTNLLDLHALIEASGQDHPHDPMASYVDWRWTGDRTRHIGHTFLPRPS